MPKPLNFEIASVWSRFPIPSPHDNGVGRGLGRWIWLGLICGCLLVKPEFSFAAGDSEGAPTPLQLYNDGTKKLREGKLPEAEVALQAAIASQDDRVQPSALYNLGEVRFQQGVEEQKKAPNSQAVRDRSKGAAGEGTDAIRAADEALAHNEVLDMASAYMQGRGARRELKAAMQAVKQAMENSGAVLAKWQRASGDFKSTAELLPPDSDAKTNAAFVDRAIAKLIDQQQMMMQAMQSMGKQRADLAMKMAELKKRLPTNEGDKLKGKGKEDDDDEEENKKPPEEPKPGQQEPKREQGMEMNLTAEEAARLLDMLKLDSNRKLPYGTNDTGKAANRKGRDW